MPSRPVGLAAAVVAVAAVALAPPQARAWDRGRPRTFAVLPAGAAGPEGLEVDPAGHVYVGSFGFTSAGSASGPGLIYVYDDDGRLLRTLTVSGSSTHLLGLRWQTSSRKLLVADFGGAQVLAVDPHSGASTVFMTLPAAARAGSSLNDITFDARGNVFVSDSFQGTIWVTGPSGGEAHAWVSANALKTTGVPPFGANGLRFNHAGSSLFVANTGDDTIVEVPVTGTELGANPGDPLLPVAGTPSVFVNSVNGADGLVIDAHDRLWIAANQADEIVVLDPTGKVVAKLGDFGGAIDDDGAPVGLLFPASLRFLGDDLLVTNLALDLRLFGLPEAVDSQWCAQVSRYTVSRIPIRPGR
jgi:sugar lactone lactonase YvrE